MDKLKMVYLNSGILFSSKKEGSTDSYYKVTEPSKHDKWKEPHTKDHILYEMSRVGKSIEMEGSFVVAWEWEEGNREWLIMNKRFLWRDDEMFWA